MWILHINSVLYNFSVKQKHECHSSMTGNHYVTSKRIIFATLTFKVKYNVHVHIFICEEFCQIMQNVFDEWKAYVLLFLTFCLNCHCLKKGLNIQGQLSGFLDQAYAWKIMHTMSIRFSINRCICTCMGYKILHNSKFFLTLQLFMSTKQVIDEIWVGSQDWNRYFSSSFLTLLYDI